MDKDGDGVSPEEWMAEFGSAEEPIREAESDQAADGGAVEVSEENESPESSEEASSEGGEATTSEEAE